MAIRRTEDDALRTAGRIGRWFDDRVGASHFADNALNHIFPDNWSFMLGEIAMYCFLILVVTGVYLTFFFHPSDTNVVYSGSYVPLRGITMSEAYESTIRLSFDVRAGLVFRQIHHWAADVFAATLVAHLCRIFFTGAFRRPREINWIIGLTMFLAVIFNGFAGYSLPDDLLSATGLRIAYSIAESIPVVGTWLASLFFGGQYPGPDTIGRLFIIHVLLLPGLIAALLGVHLALVWRQKHTQFPGAGRTEHNLVGSRLWPTYAAKSVGLLACVFAVVALLAGLAQINPVWLYGPYHTGAVSTAAQPDWYMGWLEGALRLFPAWRVHVWHHTIPEVFWPGVVLPGLTFGLLYLWPFLEARVTGDHQPHELLDRPRDRPLRTAVGCGVLSFYVALFLAGSQDIFAQHLHLSITAVNHTFQALLFVLPVLVALIAWKWCRDLAAEDRRLDTEPPEDPLDHRLDADSAVATRRRSLIGRLSDSPAVKRSWTVMAAAGAVAIALRERRSRSGKR